MPLPAPAKPKVSLVIVAWNVGAFIGEALQSALADALDGLEVIAVDNGSTDQTSAVMARAAAADPRLKVIRNAHNLGLGQGRNQGLAAARGDYIAFLDGDDWLAPGAMARAYEEAQRSGADLLVYGHTRWVSAGQQRVKPPPLPPAPDPGQLALRAAVITGPLMVWRKFLHRSLAERIAIPFPDGAYEDIRWSQRAVLLATHLAVLREALCFYRWRPGSIINSRGSYHFDALTQWRRLGDDLDELRVAPALRAAVATAMVRQTRRASTSGRLPRELQYRYFREASAVLRQISALPPPGAEAHALHEGRYMAYRTLTFPFRVAELFSRR